MVPIDGHSPLRTLGEFRPIKQGFTRAVQGFIDTAVDKGDIPAPPFPGLVVNLYWDFVGLVIFYWLKDDSPGFANTSVLIDLSLDIMVSILASGIITKAAELGAFLFKSHIYGNVESIHRLFSSVRGFHRHMMGDRNEGGAL